MLLRGILKKGRTHGSHDFRMWWGERRDKMIAEDRILGKLRVNGNWSKGGRVLKMDLGKSVDCDVVYTSGSA